MDGYSVDTKVGRVQSGEVDTIFSPRSPRTGRRGVVLLHADNSALQYTDGHTFPKSVQLAAFLAINGIPCITGQLGNTDANGDNFANDQAMSRVTAAWSLLQSVAGVASDKVLLVGASMGGATAARYAMLNPGSVAAGYGIIPASDLTDLYTRNPLGVQPQIGAAWGVTYPTALPSGADLPGQAHLASGVPWRLDYGAGDAAIAPSTVTALAAAWGSQCVATCTDPGGTFGHGDALLGLTDPATVLAFLIANGA